MARIDAAHPRQHGLHMGAFGKPQQTIATAHCIVVTLQRRCSRAKHDWHATLAGAEDRHITRRIVQTVLLLERGIVLLIDNDQ